MIEASDNGSATQLFNEVGGAPAVAAFDRSVGMTSTTPSRAWGLTVTTAADQVTLLRHLVEPNSALSDGSRAYALGLMEHVTASQAWGVSAGTVAGTTVALKNGWLPVGSGWTVNSIGWVSGSGRDYLIAVTTSADPGESYGIASISLVAAAAWGALAH
jgi:beta-lactamase class A